MREIGKDVIRDRYGKVLGYLSRYDDGSQELRNSTGRLLGRYDAQGNTTRDTSGRLLAYGNILTSLLND